MRLNRNDPLSGALKRRPGTRRQRYGLEQLEERCVLSTLAVGHASPWAHPHHPIRGAVVHPPSRRVAGPPLTASAASIHAQAAAPLQVWWSFPANGASTGVPGFIATGFSQPLNPATANGYTVQLAHKNASGGFDLLPINIVVNSGNNSVVVTPLADMPNGLYVAAYYPGLQGTSGGTIGGPYFQVFTVNDPWGQPGGPDPITVFPASNGSSGVVIADQARALDPASVNANTVRLFHVNGDGSTGASLVAGVDYGITYDPQIPSIELVLTSGLTAGNYRYVEQGVHDQAGNVMTQAAVHDFTINTTLGFPYPQGPSPIYVTAVYPQADSVTSATPISLVVFDRAADPATVNNATIGLARWLPDQNRFSAPLPTNIFYNPASQGVTIVPTQGLAEGSYLIMVNYGAQKITDTRGTPMSGPNYSHFTFYDPNGPPVEGTGFGTYPSTGTVVNGLPPAVLVFFQKFGGDVPASVNSNTVQIVPWLGDRFGNPIPANVAYNPWPGEAVLTPLVPLGDGTYVILVHGITDIAGNVQRNPFSTWFGITGTGRPLTIV